MTRYTLLRADCAGSCVMAVASTLREAAELWSAAWEGRNWNRTGVMFLVTDDERDGATVDEEELQEALMGMPEPWSEAVERVLQQFEAMAGAETWTLSGGGNIRVAERALTPRCPLLWMAGIPKWGDRSTSDAMRLLGLDADCDDATDDVFYEAADGYGDSPAHQAIRARLLAATGLA